MKKLDPLAIRSSLSRAQLLGLVVSVAACEPSLYTREPMAVTTGATGGSGSTAPGVGGASRIQGDASGASGGAKAAAPIGSGGSQGGQTTSSAAEIPGVAGGSAASPTGDSGRTETGDAGSGPDTGGAVGTSDAALAGGGGGGGGSRAGDNGGAAGTPTAGSGGAAAGGRGGSAPAAAGGSAAGGSAPAGGGGQDLAQYNFDLSVAGWQMSSDSGVVATLSRTTGHSFAGAASLEGAIVASAAGLLQVFVQSPAVAPGSRVTFHCFVPTGAAIDWVEPFIQEGGISTPPFAWTYAYLKAPELVFGAWNTVSVALPSTATAPISMGVQFHVAARWTGSVFVDSIGW